MSLYKNITYSTHYIFLRPHIVIIPNTSSPNKYTTLYHEIFLIRFGFYIFDIYIDSYLIAILIFHNVKIVQC